jgi:hypothetical protein
VKGYKADVECILWEQLSRSLEDLCRGPDIGQVDGPKGVARVIGRGGLKYNHPGLDARLLLHQPVRWEY